MATSSFNKNFCINNAKEAEVIANVRNTNELPTLNGNFQSMLKNEKEVRSDLRKALNTRMVSK